MKLDIYENELKKRLTYPYQWGQKQNDRLDKASKFIYKIRTFDELIKRLKSEFDKVENFNELFHYAINRWYNFRSAKAVEHFFSNFEDVLPNKDKYDKLVDFKIKDISFDHKTSVFPKGLDKDFNYCINNKREVLTWLYENQSREGRQHYSNRLFIMLYNLTGENHWHLKAELTLLNRVIKSYVENFNPADLVKLKLKNGQHPLSDIIWVIK